MKKILISMLVKVGLWFIKVAANIGKTDSQKLQEKISKASSVISLAFDDKNNEYDDFIEERIEEVHRCPLINKSEEKHGCCKSHE